ncbi:MAG TPA: phosphatase PAP2 family protein [Streptosporangiaceae bacterium]|nr:phosphatase PAP2 family protein [Streptosporangiaceae bacterium]
MTLNQRLGLRLMVASLAVFLLAVPFAGLLALVDTKWAPLERLDTETTKALNEYVLDHRVFVRPLQATSYVFHAWVFRSIIAVLFVWLLYRGARRLAAWAATTIVVGGVTGLVLKVLIDRPRPDLETPIAHAPGGSFPSGHAMTAAVGSAVIVMVLLPVLGAAWRAVAWGVAVVVTLASGVCRVALGVHYVSDVLAGWVLGIAVVAATAAAFEMWRRDAGRPPVHPVAEGLEPEAAARISPSGEPEPASRKR